MASAVNAPPITFEQYLAFESPNGYRDELLYGRIIVSPDPKPFHADIADNIARLLKAAVGRKYRVGQRTNLQFADEHSMPSPDVFVIPQKAWNESAAANVYPDGAEALLLVEVLSPGNRMKNIQAKADLYCRYKAEVWIVDPKRGHIKVHRENQVISFSSDLAIKLSSELGSKSIQISKIFRVPYRANLV